MNPEKLLARIGLTLLSIVWFGLLLIAVSAIHGCATQDFCTLDEPTVDSYEAKIINGEPSTNLRAAVQVFILGRGFCSGTKLGPYTVLTAAHCVDDIAAPSRIEVYDPRLDRRMKVQHFVWHPEYYETRDMSKVRRKRKAGDLAILHTLEQLKGPYARLYEGDACYPGMIAQGWGRNEDGGFSGLNERVVYETHHNRWSIFVTEAPCFGDSGSSLYLRTENPEELVILGVSSRVAKDDCRGSIGLPRHGTAIFTNTTRYYDWILDRVR
jgi:hypothetical protein